MGTTRKELIREEGKGGVGEAELAGAGLENELHLAEQGNHALEPHAALVDLRVLRHDRVWHRNTHASTRGPCW